MADLEAVLADVSYLMAMEKSKCTPAARASKKIILPDPRYDDWCNGFAFHLVHANFKMRCYETCTPFGCTRTCGRCCLSSGWAVGGLIGVSSHRWLMASVCAVWICLIVINVRISACILFAEHVYCTNIQYIVRRNSLLRLRFSGIAVDCVQQITELHKYEIESTPLPKHTVWWTVCSTARMWNYIGITTNEAEFWWSDCLFSILE